MSAEYYLKRTVDAFLSKPISTVNGRNQYVVNSGNVRNSGYSIGATVTPVVIQDFKWTLSTYFSKTFNKLKTKPGAEQFELSNFLSGTALVKGKPVGTFYSYKFIGLNPEDGGPVFDDGRRRMKNLRISVNMTCTRPCWRLRDQGNQRCPEALITRSNTGTCCYR